jgi:hypothetical protein
MRPNEMRWASWWAFIAVGCTAPPSVPIVALDAGSASAHDGLTDDLSHLVAFARACADAERDILELVWVGERRWRVGLRDGDRRDVDLADETCDGSRVELPTLPDPVGDVHLLVALAVDCAVRRGLPHEPSATALDSLPTGDVVVHLGATAVAFQPLTRRCTLP